VVLWDGLIMDYQQNKVAYITGSSRGIGLALVTELIQAGYFVIGISRGKTLIHQQFHQVNLDLNDLAAVKDFTFDFKGEEVLLINNAGMLGDVKPIGAMSASNIQAIMNVNTIAPQIMINSFLKTFQNKAKKGHIITISSGAGKYPIDAWATYCASKAAMDLYSETVAAELQARSHTNWTVHSIAPGVVDTTMQTHIRSSNSNDFLGLDKFIQLKENDELASPIDVAMKIMRVINDPFSFKNTTTSVRDFS
jgi:benzil reductase ((S)-benzoin forming)